MDNDITYTISVNADNDCGWGSATCTIGKDGLINGMSTDLSGQGLHHLGDTEAIERAAIKAANDRLAKGIDWASVPEGESLILATVHRDKMTAEVCASRD